MKEDQIKEGTQKVQGSEARLNGAQKKKNAKKDETEEKSAEPSTKVSIESAQKSSELSEKSHAKASKEAYSKGPGDEAEAEAAETHQKAPEKGGKGHEAEYTYTCAKEKLIVHKGAGRGPGGSLRSLGGVRIAATGRAQEAGGQQPCPASPGVSFRAGPIFGPCICPITAERPCCCGRAAY